MNRICYGVARICEFLIQRPRLIFAILMGLLVLGLIATLGSIVWLLESVSTLKFVISLSVWLTLIIVFLIFYNIEPICTNLFRTSCILKGLCTAKIQQEPLKWWEFFKKMLASFSFQRQVREISRFFNLLIETLGEDEALKIMAKISLHSPQDISLFLDIFAAQYVNSDTSALNLVKKWRKEIRKMAEEQGFKIDLPPSGWDGVTWKWLIYLEPAWEMEDEDQKEFHQIWQSFSYKTQLLLLALFFRPRTSEYLSK